MDERIIAALIGAAVAGLLAYLREQRMVARRRAEKIRDLQVALSAEIRAYLAVLKLDDPDAFAERMLKRMREHDENGDAFIPFVPREKNDTIFQVIAGDLHMLPQSSVDPVVVYYSQVIAIAALIEDLRSPEYKALSVERRIDLYKSYLSMKSEAIALGEEALLLMQKHLDGGPKAVDDLQNKRDKLPPDASRAKPVSDVSSPASVRSDQ